MDTQIRPIWSTPVAAALSKHATLSVIKHPKSPDESLTSNNKVSKNVDADGLKCSNRPAQVPRVAPICSDRTANHRGHCQTQFCARLKQLDGHAAQFDVKLIDEDTASFKSNRLFNCCLRFIGYKDLAIEPIKYRDDVAHKLPLKDIQKGRLCHTALHNVNLQCAGAAQSSALRECNTHALPASPQQPQPPSLQATAEALRTTMLQCAAEAQTEQPHDADARLRCFIAKLSGSMECLGEVKLDHALWDLMKLRVEPHRPYEVDTSVTEQIGGAYL